MTRVVKRSSDVRLHVWGGLGGQLLGIAYALYLAERRGMMVKLLFNSGGASRRDLAVAKILATDTLISRGISWATLNGPLGREKKSLRYGLEYINSGLWPVTHRYGVITRENLDELGGGLRNIDGYPIDFNVAEEVSELLAEAIAASGYPDFLAPTEPQEGIAVHWRLGDYVNNSFHGVISPRSIRVGLDIVKPGWKPSEVTVFTDSPELLKSAGVISALGNLGVESSDIWTDLKRMASYGAFLGSHSLISQWVSLAILQRGQAQSFLLPAHWFAEERDGFFVSPTPAMKLAMRWTPEFTDSIK